MSVLVVIVIVTQVVEAVFIRVMPVRHEKVVIEVGVQTGGSAVSRSGKGGHKKELFRGCLHSGASEDSAGTEQFEHLYLHHGGGAVQIPGDYYVGNGGWDGWSGGRWSREAC